MAALKTTECISHRMPRDHEIDMTISAERCIRIAASRERVWQAITTAGQLDLWYAPGSTWEINVLKVGETVKFHHVSLETLEATIDVCCPMNEFALRWAPDTTYPQMTLVTTFLLENDGECTRIIILESGYEALPDDVRQAWIDRTHEGYEMSLENLKATVEGRSILHIWTPPSSQL